MRNVLIALLWMVIPAPALALSPIARTDVVPYQYITYGSSFNFGVLAFSKAGIDRVEFTISGPGYSGNTKIASSMRPSARLACTKSVIPKSSPSEVWEYYVTISSNEFTSDGEVIVSPTVYGSDGGVRVLESVPLIVEATSPGSYINSWVDSVRGSDSKAVVANAPLPFKTIGAAVSAGPGDSDGSRDDSGGGSGCFMDTLRSFIRPIVYGFKKGA